MHAYGGRWVTFKLLSIPVSYYATKLSHRTGSGHRWSRNENGTSMIKQLQVRTIKRSSFTGVDINILLIHSYFMSWFSTAKQYDLQLLQSCNSVIMHLSTGMADCIGGFRCWDLGRLKHSEQEREPIMGSVGFDTSGSHRQSPWSGSDLMQSIPSRRHFYAMASLFFCL